MVVGNQQLEGKTQKLTKPLYVLRRIRMDHGKRQFSAIGTIKTKFVFRTRPVPIINLPEKKAAAKKTEPLDSIVTDTNE